MERHTQFFGSVIKHMWRPFIIFRIAKKHCLASGEKLRSHHAQTHTFTRSGSSNNLGVRRASADWKVDVNRFFLLIESKEKPFFLIEVRHGIKLKRLGQKFLNLTNIGFSIPF